MSDEPAATCPGCGTPTRPRKGFRTMCFDCSVTDTGETWEKIKSRTRVTEARSAKINAGGRADQAIVR